MEAGTARLSKQPLRRGPEGRVGRWVPLLTPHRPLAPHG